MDISPNFRPIQFIVTLKLCKYDERVNEIYGTTMVDVNYSFLWLVTELFGLKS